MSIVFEHPVVVWVGLVAFGVLPALLYLAFIQEREEKQSKQQKDRLVFEDMLRNAGIR